MRDELLEIERAGWEALSTSGEAATRFYTENLAREVLMLLPGGTIIDDRDQVIASMGGAPWTAFELRDHRILRLDAGSAVVAYRATAERDGVAYSALIASTYVRQAGAWKLAFHQQTPV